MPKEAQDDTNDKDVTTTTPSDDDVKCCYYYAPITISTTGVYVAYKNLLPPVIFVDIPFRGNINKAMAHDLGSK